jgi:predicted RNA-binding Zn-ribbon protein involved in translation (DUF1610 family)
MSIVQEGGGFMIRFCCEHCGHKISVRDEHAGKRGKCPSCADVVTVPDKSLLIDFNCENCGEKISAVRFRIGKTGKCPKCGLTLVVPGMQGQISAAKRSNAESPEAHATDSARDLTLLDVPQEYRLQDRPGTPQKTIEQEQEFDEDSAAEESESAVQRELPWFIDIFLYPTSTPGLIHLAIFIGLPLIIRLVMWLLGPFALALMIPSFIINLLIGLYMGWYFAECVRESASGDIRVAEAFVTADLGSMFGQCLYLGACYIIFGFPAFLYSTFTNRTDVIFWILVAYGVFFFPMGLLAVVMFNSGTAFNPILLIGSILSTFFQYCGLVLLICGIVLAVMALTTMGQSENIQQIEVGTMFLEILFSCILLYTAFVVAHLLGRFYWRYQEKLNWEV